MYIEKFLHQFWRCTDVVSTGEDKAVCDAGHYREKLVNRHTFLSGMRLDYDFDEPGYPANLVFEVWDTHEEDLAPGYFPTGRIIELKAIKNGFVAVTGDSKGKTTYTFKKTKINPLRERTELHKRIVDTENSTANPQELSEEKDVELDVLLEHDIAT